MNTAVASETRALAATTDQPTTELALPSDTASMILGPSFERVQAFAGMMAKGAVSVPKHLRGNIGDCMAITIQALGWKMNPFSVAQKTHLSQSGALGYEAQLISAVLVSSGAVVGEPNYEPVGDWNKVLGKVEEKEGKKRDDGSAGGKYYAAAYNKKDEEGLGVIVRAQLRGETKPRELTVMMSQAYPRFSTQWATDPYQQLCYLAVRKWARLNSPGSILGVNTVDELDAYPSRDMGPAEVVAPKIPQELLAAAYAAADKGREAFNAWWKQCLLPERNLLAGEVNNLKTRTEAADRNRTVDNAPTAKTTPAAAASTTTTAQSAEAGTKIDGDGVITPTYASVMDKMLAAHKKKDRDALAIAADWIASVPEAEQRAELKAKFDELNADLSK